VVLKVGQVIDSADIEAIDFDAVNGVDLFFTKVNHIDDLVVFRPVGL